MCALFFFKQKTAYEMRISDWSSDVCSSDLIKEAPKEKTRESATPTTSASPSASREQATRKRQSATTTRERVTTISGYTYCGNSAGAAQPCIDNGRLVLY